MSNLKYHKHEILKLRDHPEFSEKWLQTRIQEDPSILGLGEVEVIDVERRQPKAGRLDILLRNPETLKRYEVEIMLGEVDESHIIRSIEYWDIERKRYPQYEHCAVIVAENITSRFLNVISLFNSSIPIIAIQLNALKIDDKILLGFTKVLDELRLGTDEEDKAGQTVDRSYWEEKASKETLALADECVKIINEFDSSLSAKYNVYYIGLAINGRPNNFVIFRPKKKFIQIVAKVIGIDEWSLKLEENGFTVLEGPKKDGRVGFTVTKEQLKQKQDIIREILKVSYDEQSS